MALSARSLTFITQKGLPYLRENAKSIGQFILTIFFVGLGIWFIQHEQAELGQVRQLLVTASWQWVAAGIGLTVAYLLIQGLMYVASFAAIGSRVPLYDAVILFLKRNFVSIFLPAGGISSLAFFTGDLTKKGVSKSQIHFASSIYAFVGILSVVVVAIPAFGYALVQGTLGSGEWVALLGIIVLVAGLYGLYRSILAKGILYKKLIRYFPAAELYIEDLLGNRIDRRHFALTVFYSVLIELVGVAHVYIAMVALGLKPSLFAALMSYIVAVIFLIISPFLRGLGAIEVSMSFILVRFGYTEAAAVSVTFLFRFLEFWLPLFAGAASFLLKINKLLLRIFPALLLFVLGVVNIVSVLTPAINQRLSFLKGVLPTDAIEASNFFVLIAGLFLLVTAAFMLKGLRMAWYFAVVLCGLSIVGNITKAIDYEEAIFSFVTLLILLVSRREYYVKNNRKLGIIGVQTTLLSCAAVLLYGCIGFYFLDRKHFVNDFSLGESVRYTLQNFFLIGSRDLVPQDAFAQRFLYSINFSGFLCLAFLIYTLVRPYIIKAAVEDEDLAWARTVLQKHGCTALDHFKTYFDKIIFKPDSLECFIAYRVTGSYAVVLEGPVGPRESWRACISAFNKFCRESGLKSLYYRVPEENLALFPKKKKILLGQEAVMDLTTFSLDGGARKSIRNALKKVSEKGYQAKVYQPPINDGLLQKLKSVSDEWLVDTERSEIVFSQGMFLWDELKQQTILTVENPEEKIVAFLNVIPDYAPGEGTYDLIRKTKDAPGGVIDFITVELFRYLKTAGYTSVNLGFAPMSGIAEPQNLPERSMKFAYEKIRSFGHYKGLRDFKDKFAPTWHNKYLLFNDDYDLFNITTVLAKVIKP
jgi:phosphatidylglycerol lysyltransferase